MTAVNFYRFFSGTKDRNIGVEIDEEVGPKGKILSGRLTRFGTSFHHSRRRYHPDHFQQFYPRVCAHVHGHYRSRPASDQKLSMESRNQHWYRRFHLQSRSQMSVELLFLLLLLRRRLTLKACSDRMLKIMTKMGKKILRSSVAGRTLCLLMTCLFFFSFFAS